MKFVIDRSKWRCGQNGKFKLGAGETLLENEQGYMCCLGQIARQLDNNIILLDRISPEDLKVEVSPLCIDINGHIEDTELSSDAMDINDNMNFTNITREEKLIELFNDHGHEIEFINEGYEND